MMHVSGKHVAVGGAGMSEVEWSDGVEMCVCSGGV